MSRRKKVAAPATTHAAAATVRRPQVRIPGLDALRGAAICAMIVYHFAFDLNWYGALRADFNRDAGWLTFRAIIVSAFLLLVGISLVLAQRDRPNRLPSGAFWKRLGIISGCALLVTLASYVTFRPTFITFGILHCIAVSSLLAWPLVRYPLAAGIVGVVVIAMGVQVQIAAFDSRWLNWVGLMTHKPATEDYVPLFPWFGVVCLGIGAGGWLVAKKLAPLRAPSPVSPGWLQWLGRHSLLVYMVHQPILLGILRIVVPG
ncbi:MAG: heparan-alpha-glucosaminide N-acetyltransferase [Betaproteobacteria bacterium]